MDDERSVFEKAFYEKNPPGTLEKLRSRKVGIAGAGGLGSNIAVALVRAGVGNLVIADFDTIEMSNLNRQQYFSDQVGMVKVEALRVNLMRINPYISVEAKLERVDRGNIERIFGDCDILIEAFDRAEAKVMLVEGWLELHPDRYVVCGSGLAGYGGSNSMRTTAYGKLVVCGDQHTESDPANGLTAPRVAIAAAMEANAAVRILLDGSPEPNS